MARSTVAVVATGAAAGAIGVALTLLLHLVQHIAFGYTETSFLVGVQHASGRRRILAVTIGGLVVGPGWWLHRRRGSPRGNTGSAASAGSAGDAGSAGSAAEPVSVTGALRSRSPSLPVLATTTDAILQIVAVGAGASLGREGAPRQLGAMAGALVAARLGLPLHVRRRLLACGAGAGLAAVYNVPLGGALFTLEVLLVSIGPADVVAALASSLIATALSWPVLSDAPTYRIARFAPVPPAAVLVWAGLVGPVAALVGMAFVRLTRAARRYRLRDWRMSVTIPAAFAALGAAAVAYPQLLGNGKGPAGLAISAALPLGLAATLLLLKPLATALCLGSGAIGGLLTPAFATGALLGVTTGQLWSKLWSGGPGEQYALIGAAAVLAVTQRAPFTAIALTLEFVGTGAGHTGLLALPMAGAVALALVTVRFVEPSLLPAWLLAARTARGSTHR